ncbi:MAG TPA: DUF4112 domain-containing protein [Tepidisphaeraceae bacterium]|jgi:hypothetical protein
MEESVRVKVSRVLPLTSDLGADLARAEAVAKWMDGQFKVAGVPFGFDALIGLVPVAGDAVSFCIGLYPVYIARKHKLGNIVIARMLANLGLDFLAGSVPLAGDVLDVFVKANLKNVALLKKAASKLQSLP